MEEFLRALDKHTEDDRRSFDHIGERLVKITDNHLAHLQDAVANLKADIVWIKWIVLTAAGASIIAVITNIARIVVR